MQRSRGIERERGSFGQYGDVTLRSSDVFSVEVRNFTFFASILFFPKERCQLIIVLDG